MENTCQTCKDFVQHYIRRERRYSAIPFGHCIHFRRVKHRKADAPACERYRAQPAPRRKPSAGT